MISLIVWTFIAGFKAAGGSSHKGVISAVALLMEVFFGTFLVSVLIESVVELCQAARTNKNSCRAVFGDGTRLCYVCPTPAFADKGESLSVDWLTNVVV